MLPSASERSRVSFHPAGHILGSSQIRIEHGGEVWVVSGDYKLAPDPTCAPFEPVRCHTFVTESTFGLPIFRWNDAAQTVAEIQHWWRANRQSGRASILFAYPVGKAQRILSMLDAGAGPLVFHEPVERINAIYRAQGIALPLAGGRFGVLRGADRGFAAAPRGRHGCAASVRPPPRLRRAGCASADARRRRSLDRGFVLSDHADWPALLQAIGQTGAETVWVTHGYIAPLVRWLQEHGKQAVPVELAMPANSEAAPAAPEAEAGPE